MLYMNGVTKGERDQFLNWNDIFENPKGSLLKTMQPFDNLNVM